MSNFMNKTNIEITDEFAIECIECDLKWHSSNLSAKHKAVLKYAIEAIKNNNVENVRNQAIDEFTNKMIIMMPGHRQDIENIAKQMKKDSEKQEKLENEWEK